MSTFGKIGIKLVIFTVREKKLLVFMPKNKLPGGELKSRQALDNLAEKIFEKAMDFSSRGHFFEQLYTFSHPKREKEEVDVVYYFLVPDYQISNDTIKDWRVANSLSSNLPDKEIIDYATQRLRWKIEYTNVVYSLLPNEFTFSHLQNVYEAILGRTLDKRNFRKKILSLGILKETGHIRKSGKALPACRLGRPAEMFAFKEKKLTLVKIL